MALKTFYVAAGHPTGGQWVYEVTTHSVKKAHSLVAWCHPGYHVYSIIGYSATNQKEIPCLEQMRLLS